MLYHYDKGEHPDKPMNGRQYAFYHFTKDHVSKGVVIDAAMKADVIYALVDVKDARRPHIKLTPSFEGFQVKYVTMQTWRSLSIKCHEIT